jgi:hypothetical protein
MKPSLILPLMSALALLLVTAQAMPVSITVNSNGGSKYTTATGSLLATGSVVRVGQFNVIGGNLTTLQTSNDYATVNSLFTPLAESLLNAGTVNQAGAPGQQLVINDLFAAGDIFGQIVNAEDFYFATGSQLYAWVFNNANPLLATEWGIFSSTTGWGYPMMHGSETLSTFEVDQVIRGNDTGTELRLANIAAVPEPGSALLALVGGLALFRRSRRA